MNKISYNLMKYRAMSPKQKRILKAKVWFSVIYLLPTSIYGQYKLPLDAYHYTREWVVATSKGIALANGAMVETKVVKEKDSETAKAIEAASEKLAKVAADAAKEGADQSIKNNLGKK